MPYRYLEDATFADVAFVAEGRTLAELFQAAADALTNTMVKDISTIGRKAVRDFDLEASGVEMLLYRFLQELIFYKDAERLVFSRYEVEPDGNAPPRRLRVRAWGEEIAPEKHELAADVKAVSFHKFVVRQNARGWTASVIVDV